MFIVHGQNRDRRGEAVGGGIGWKSKMASCAGILFNSGCQLLDWGFGGRKRRISEISSFLRSSSVAGILTALMFVNCHSEIDVGEALAAVFETGLAK